MTITLKDNINIGNSIDFSILYHIKGEDEGSRLVFHSYIDNKINNELEFGWTNRTLQNFIELLKHFPIEKYNGYFSHYEKHLELYWKFEPETDLYSLIFDLLTEDESTFTLTTTKKFIHEFGIALENELKNAPSIEEYLKSSNNKE